MNPAKQPPPLPVMVELAPLPRAQVGPFLILGLDKEASKDEAEAGWAQRLVWARRNVIKTPLEDINWARDMLGDPQRRLQADAASLNLDTAEGTLRRLRQELQSRTGCKPIDVEKDLANFLPTAPVPSVEELRRNITLPELPTELPAVPQFLEQFINKPLDPWDSFPTATEDQG